MLLSDTVDGFPKRKELNHGFPSEPIAMLSICGSGMGPPNVYAVSVPSAATLTTTAPLGMREPPNVLAVTHAVPFASTAILYGEPIPAGSAISVNPAGVACATLSAKPSVIQALPSGAPARPCGCDGVLGVGNSSAGNVYGEAALPLVAYEPIKVVRENWST